MLEKEVQKYWGTLPSNRWWCVRVIDTNKQKLLCHKHIETLEKLLKIARKYDRKANVYISRNPRVQELKDHIADVPEIRALSFDYDIKRNKEYPASAAEIKRALQVVQGIADCCIEQVQVYFTGNGFHLEYSFAPRTITSREQAERLTEASRQLEDYFRSTFLAKLNSGNLVQDSIHDVTRIVKVPGTESVKGYENVSEQRIYRTARLAYVSPSSAGASISMEKKFDEYFMRARPKLRQADVQPDAPLPERFETELRSDRLLAGLWKGDDTSRSGKDWHLALQLARKGYSKEEIKAILLQYSGGKARERDDRYVEQLVAKLDTEIRDIGCKPARQILEELFVEMKKRKKASSTEKTNLCLPEFNKYFWSLQQGRQYIVAGRPSIGKTSFTIQNIIYWLKHQKKVLLLPTEMSVSDTIYKLCSQYLEYPMEELERGEHAKEMNAIDLPLWNLYISNIGSPSISRIEAMVKRFDPHIVVIDHIQHTDRDSSNPVYDLERIVRAAKNISKEYNVIVWIVSQLNRMQHKQPQLTDLKWCGALEEEADGVIFLYGDRPIHTDEPYYIKYSVAKNRFGSRGQGLLEFNPVSTTFSEVQEDEL